MEYEPKSYFTFGIKKKLGLKGKLFWNVVYCSILWQVVFAIIYLTGAFILWSFDTGWADYVFRGALLLSVINSIWWCFCDHFEEKETINNVAESL